MKYIRTKDNCIYKVVKENDYIFEVDTLNSYCNNAYDIFINKEVVIKQADTIEELIQDNDILYIHDLYPDAVLVVEGNIKPFGYKEYIKLNEWLKYKNKFDLYIRDSKNNYICIAKMNDKGELELI